MDKFSYERRLELMANYVKHHDHYQASRKEMVSIGGELVKFLRGLCKMSVRKFALALNVTPSYLSKVERGLEPLSPELARTILEMHDAAHKEAHGK